jgi:putative ABC transport system permease protein
MRLFDIIRQDARHSIRILLQNRGFATVAILSLALGIGANTAIFTLIDTVLLRSLPVEDPERLAVFALNPDKPSVGSNYPDYVYIRDHNKSFSGVIASGGGGATAMEVPGEGAQSVAQLVNIHLVSGNYFDVLGVKPAVGRLLGPADNTTEDAHPWVVLDYDFWQRRFGGDPRVVGRAITLNGSPFNIVGVSRAGFTGTVVGNHPNVYLPIMMLREVRRGVRAWNSRHYWWLTIIGRLKPGVTMQAASPEMDLLWKQILASDPERRPVKPFEAKDYEARNRGTLISGSGGYSFLRNQIQKPLAVLMTVVTLVLLIACANVANLLLARAASRQKEIAIRLAVGASRARLISQLIFETVIVALIGGLVSVAFAWWGVRVLLAFLPKRAIPVELNVSPDWRLLLFSFGISVTAALLCGLAPAFQATRPNLTTALKNEMTAIGRVRFDLRRALVVAQVAMSLLLLIGAGLFVRSLSNLRSLDPGFVRERVLMVDVNPQASGYKGQRLRDFYDRLLTRVHNLQGVRMASLANITPLGGSRWNSDIVVEGYTWKPQEKPYIDFNSVSHGYFETMGIPIVAGRDFRPEDNPAVSPDPKPQEGPDDQKLGPPPAVAIVNEAMANHFFPHQSAIGRHFTHGEKWDAAKIFEIVGVVKDAKYFDLRKPVEAMIYVPAWRFGAGSKTLCVRSSGRPEQLVSAIRAEVANIDRAIPVLGTLTMEEQFDNNISQERVVTSLCSFFGSLAVVLAAVGLYGVMAHSVTRRYREIGIRMALGANAPNVLWLVLRDTAIMIGIGACIGLPAAFALTRLVSSFLFGLTPQDPLSIALATAGLMVVTAIAGYIPARRATRVDPMIALRYE